MDVLEYWSPNIDWAKFKRGPVSERMWALFCQLVQLCHAFAHWENVAHAQRLTPLPRSLYQESKYKNKKRRDERKREIERSDDHRYRAAYLAAERMAAMSELLTQERNADAKRYIALRLAIAPFPNHVKARCKVAAFDEFDADVQLAGEVDEIAERWLDAAGYP